MQKSGHNRDGTGIEKTSLLRRQSDDICIVAELKLYLLS